MASRGNTRSCAYGHVFSSDAGAAQGAQAADGLFRHTKVNTLTRRRFIESTALLGGGLGLGVRAAEQRSSVTAGGERALVAITLDMEMSRNFPTWDATHWDYEKGNLNEPTKRYCVEAARRVKAQGGVIHFFAVGQVFEQESVAWLQEIAQAGHPIGNHTYDHINVLATKLDDLQFRFKRAPWLIAGKQPADVIRENILQTNAAIRTRLGVEPAGFRTPGGFERGLSEREDLQRMLLDLGFRWISCQAPKVNVGPAGGQPTPAILDTIVRAQAAAQPYVYPSGLVEVPMSPISDVHAFRNAKWTLDSFLEAIRVGVTWAIERGAVYDFLAHPSVLYPMDPEFKAIDLICRLVREAGSRAALVDVGALAARAKQVAR